jgi:hypothetical protein
LFGAIKPRRDSRLPTLRDLAPCLRAESKRTLWQRLPRGVRARKRTTWPCAKCRVTSDTSTNLWTRPYGQQTLLSHPSALRTHRLCRTCFPRESETSTWNPTCSGFRGLYGASVDVFGPDTGLFGVHEFFGTHAAVRHGFLRESTEPLAGSRSLADHGSSRPTNPLRIHRSFRAPRDYVAVVDQGSLASESRLKIPSLLDKLCRQVRTYLTRCLAPTVVNLVVDPKT